MSAFEHTFTYLLVVGILRTENCVLIDLIHLLIVLIDFLLVLSYLCGVDINSIRCIASKDSLPFYRLSIHFGYILSLQKTFNLGKSHWLVVQRFLIFH